MAKIEITQNHTVTAEEAKKRHEGLSKELGEKYGLTSKWNSDTEVEVKRTGASGTIKIEPKQVKVNLDLGFGVSMMKGPIEEKIKGELKKLFEGQGA